MRTDNKNPPYEAGVTLVELSIVLLIISLIIGGTLASQQLIRSAEIRKIYSDTQKYEAAYYNFRRAYLAMPGDMTNATQFWGAADGSTGTTSACYSTPEITMATCNGDGNSQITNVAWGSESLLAWKHFQNAGMIEGQFNGIGDGTSGGRWTHYPGINCPSSVAGTCFALATRSSFDPLHDFPIVGNMVWMRVGKLYATGGTPRNPFLTPEEMLSIDEKIDDGFPATGSVRALLSTSSISPGCTTTDAATTARYNLGSGNLCTLDYYFENM